MWVLVYYLSLLLLLQTIHSFLFNHSQSICFFTFSSIFFFFITQRHSLRAHCLINVLHYLFLLFLFLSSPLYLCIRLFVCLFDHMVVYSVMNKLVYLFVHSFYHLINIHAHTHIYTHAYTSYIHMHTHTPTSKQIQTHTHTHTEPPCAGGCPRCVCPPPSVPSRWG